jgi:hypothetical protein
LPGLSFRILRSAQVTTSDSRKVAAGVRKPELDLEDVVAIIQDQLPPDIEATRRYQTLQAIVNCTRRSLLPDPTVSKETREGWRQEIAALERSGIR